MSYDVVAICAESCCITADLLIFNSLMEQLSNNVDSSVTIKSSAFEVVEWRWLFSGCDIPKWVDDWSFSAGISEGDDVNDADVNVQYRYANVW